MPRGPRRRLQIVRIAEKLFLDNGFAETTMQMVAAAAGASKETLYRHFGSKEELFAEVVNNRALYLRRSLDADVDRPGAICDVLRELGTNLLEAMTRPEIIALMRLVVAEAQRAPALGEIFYSVGPEQTRAHLTAFLSAAAARGEFHAHNPALAASIFLGAIMSQHHTARLVLKDPPAMSAADIAERVDEVVAMFLRHYATVDG